MGGKLDQPIICPHCGEKNDGITHVGGRAIYPRQGDLGICAGCQGFLVYEGSTTARKLSDEEFAGLPLDTRKVLADARWVIKFYHTYRPKPEKGAED